MPPNVSPSIEVSIAVLSWINDRLRQSAQEAEASERLRTTEWMQHAVTVLAVGLSGLCVMVLQRWS
jgi:uncharacterized membrane protein